MFLHRIHLDPRCREARRDLADPYQLHSTLCRAFSAPDSKCPVGEFLWRLEPETDPAGRPRILVQSRALPDWAGIGVKSWLAQADPAIDLRDRLKLDSLKVGQRFRFRLRANPCVTRNGKRLGLLRLEEQEAWIARKGQQHGFALPPMASFDFAEASSARVDVRVSQEQMLSGKQHSGNGIRIYSVLYDGVIMVTAPDTFREVLQAGIGHGKAMGLGLLSVAR
ncbi:MAG: type I-E CRISPR-associated protein Cas6/Cse3/CasE [Deltaproteobacteria bacterium RIFOXYD12_FULL_55_16]|nr:MAG: type I-E CRISPR-associated protein Cas6/Cse3/CasE [Deltaproteobacteria bacterium RIFOXYD12_FULL_55_16]